MIYVEMRIEYMCYYITAIVDQPAIVSFIIRWNA